MSCYFAHDHNQSRAGKSFTKNSNSHPSVTDSPSKLHSNCNVERSRLEEQEMLTCWEPDRTTASHVKLSGATVGPGVTGTRIGSDIIYNVNIVTRLNILLSKYT